MTCKECESLKAEVKRLQRMLDYSQDQEAMRANEVGELRQENYNLRYRLRDSDQMQLTNREGN